MRRSLFALVALPVFAVACASHRGDTALAGSAPAPEAVRPPAEASLAMVATAIGATTYECRGKQGGGYEWAYAGQGAALYRAGELIGKYVGGQRWEASDGSRVAGTPVASAPAAPGNLPLQLVKAEPTGGGAMGGVRYIQRLNTKGGVTPLDPCGAANDGARRQVAYRADYHFYR